MSIVEKHGLSLYEDRLKGIPYLELQEKYSIPVASIKNALQRYRKSKSLPLSNTKTEECPDGETLNKWNFKGLRSPELAAKFNCNIEDVRTTLQEYRARVYG